ncbi:SGNH/GDSL hydrolase family protein [Lysobacter korlensis]|uniref:SGNH/GDSL hydrolase family protein n=1 Tax=Lysobacter korlensis TaxID=553636 RepID=A0ABV6RMC3_9GAMM
MAASGHVVLLGDSIFDNGVYVPGGPDVVQQLQVELPSGWDATLLAVDGDVTTGVPRQLRSAPVNATHLVVSVGGNDALGYADVLQQPAGSVGEGLLLLAGAQQQFAADYEAMLDAVLTAGLPTAVCTIYDTRPSEPGHPMIRTGIALFNDCITRAAFSRGVPLIDLRLICTEPGDYANPIEPSVQGGRKIATAIGGWLTGGGSRRSEVVAR